MTPRKLPPQDYLNKMFRYDEQSGKLYRRISVNYNAQAGDEVGCKDTYGYLQAWVDGNLCKVHRVIWKMVYGVDPNQIDHIDGNPSNNRTENLRSVSQNENLKNSKIHKYNTSGTTGVRYYKPRKKWNARININSESKHLGYFSDKQDAISARKTAEIKYGYHENHGRK